MIKYCSFYIYIYIYWYSIPYHISCRPDVSLDFIQSELGFDSIEQALKFLGEQKANFLRANNNKALDAKAAYAGLMESSKKYKKIDIKGQL